MFRSEYAEDRFIKAFENMAESLGKLANRPAQELETRTFDDVRRLVIGGQKIEAIRLFRALTNASLKDAKDQVDAIRG